MSHLLKAAGLRFAYSQVQVLDDVSLVLEPGRVAALIGPNGSGKSTLIRLLCGHLHGEGEIVILDRPLQQWRRRMLARTIAYLPQNPTFDPADRVADVLKLGRACYWGAFGVESDADLKVVHEVAELLELPALLSRRMDELSGGQRQRVFIGRCLVQQPSILFLDEPNTYLDLRHQVDLLRILQSLAHDRGLSVLMASHDLNLAGAFSDVMMLLSEGKIVARGAADEVMQPSLIGPAYGLPMIQLLEPRHHLLFPDLDTGA